MAAHIHTAEGGRRLDILGNPTLEKATSQDLNGAAAVFVQTVMPAGGPPAHVHLATDEFFYLLEGELDVWVDDQHAKLTPGMSATLPRGRVHRFDNLSQQPVRMLIVVTPGSGARFFDDIDRVRPALPGAIDQLAAIIERHDIRIAG